MNGHTCGMSCRPLEYFSVRFLIRKSSSTWAGSRDFATILAMSFALSAVRTPILSSKNVGYFRFSVVKTCSTKSTIKFAWHFLGRAFSTAYTRIAMAARVFLHVAMPALMSLFVSRVEGNELADKEAKKYEKLVPPTERIQCQTLASAKRRNKKLKVNAWTL